MSYEQVKENLLALCGAVEVLATAPGTLVERVPQTAAHLLMLETANWPEKLREGMAMLRHDVLPIAPNDESAALLAARIILNLEKQFHVLLDEYEE